MEKLSLLTINPTVSHYCKRIKALKIFFLAFIFSCINYAGLAQVTVTPATGGTVICSQTAAVGGSAPACTTLGVITISERGSTADFAIGADQIILNPPLGWQFCTGTAPVLGYIPGRDITAVPTVGAFTTGSITINFNVATTFRLDQITIAGLQVQPSTVGATPGFIYASSEVGITGITTGPGGTDFGDLRLAATTATLYTVTGGGAYCAPGGAGPHVGLSGSDLGLNYELFNGATLVSTVTGTGGVLDFGPQTTAGTYTVKATNGCGLLAPMVGSAIVTISPTTILAITGVPSGPIGNLCAYIDSELVSDATTGGIWNSDLVTIDTVGLPVGEARVQAFASGLATITYTLAGGCSTMTQLTVNPNPGNIQGPDSVCVGSSVVLSDTLLGGTWFSSNTTVATIGSVSGVLTGATPGTSVITYTSAAGGCDVSVTITVNLVPSTIVGDSVICVGSSTTLSSSPAGGTWASGNTHVATVISIGGGEAVVFGANIGTAPILYTLPTTCATLTSVTVDPVPAPINGFTTVCVGSTVTLTDFTSGGGWSITNTSVATIDPLGDVTGLMAGVDTIIYTLSAGLCTAMFVITVEPLPAPILGPDSLCVNSTIVLTDSTPDGTWSSSNPVAFIESGLVTGFAPGGTSVITYTLPTGCSTSVTVTVNGLPNPIVSVTGADSLCVGSVIALYDISGGGIWTVSDTTVANIQSISSNGDTVSIIGIAAGFATITYTLSSGGCIATYSITVDPIPPTPVGPASMCQGDPTVTFTDSEPGGTWSIDPGSDSVATIDTFTGHITTGSSGGVVTITYTGRGACPSKVNLTVFPVVPIGASDSVICQGSTLVLTEVPGGTWSSSNTGVAVVVSGPGSDGIVTGMGFGTAIITYEFSYSGSTLQCPATLQITVNPVTPLIGGPAGPVCVNDTFGLFDGVGPGTWTSSNTAVATVNGTGEVYPFAPGQDTITYIVSASGCNASYYLTVNAIPDAISGTDSVCVGSTNLLYNDSTGGEWITSALAIATVTPGGIPATYGGVSAGVATITYTLPDGCSAYVQVTVDPSSPIYSADSVYSVCVLDSIPLIDTTAGGIWGSTNPSIATVTATGMVTGVSAGVDTITYFVPVGGCPRSITITVNPLPAPITGIDSLCVGNTTHLFDTSAGGLGTWTSFPTTIATITDSGIVTGVAAGTNIVTYTLPNTGCMITTIVTVDPLPTPIYGRDTFMCAGDSIIIHDTTAGGVWTTSNSLVATVVAYPNDSAYVKGLTAGTATIGYTLLTGGCPAFLTVTVYPIPNVTISDSGYAYPPVICKGASVKLEANGADPGGTYVWSPAYGLSLTITPNPFASPTITTTYEVIGTTQYGCRDSAFVTVTVDSALNHLKIVGIDSICDGLCETLMASGNPEAVFNWHPTNGLSVAIGDTIVACPTATTNYVAVAIDAMGCVDSAQFKITVNPIPDIYVKQPLHPPVIVCRGVPTQIIVSVSNADTSTMKYAWSPDILISCDSCDNPYVSDTFNLVYRVIATTIYGCYDSLNVKVSVLDTNVNTISDDTNICIGDSTMLLATSNSVTSNLDVPTYYWTPGTGLNFDTVQNPIATPTVTTTYYVYIHENACFTQKDSITVYVQPLPAISISPASPISIVAGTPTTLIATAPNVTVAHYMWAPGNSLNCDTCYDPVATPTSNTTYTVTVTSIYGCVYTDSVTILMLCDNSEIFVPNTFTPNGDGVNDRFFVSGKGISQIINFSVYNRWGQQVFQAHNIQANDAGAGWDGTFKGLVLEPDVFIYVIDAQCELGTTFHYQGDVSIVK